MATQLPSPTAIRLQASFLALFLGYFFVYGVAQELWNKYWLVKDGQQGLAVVTAEHWAGHNVVLYRYRVSGKEYAGRGSRSIENPKYAHVTAGENTVVFYSSSHPWLSAIDHPHFVSIDGLPVALFVWLIEASLVAAIINPKGRWALNLTGQRRPPARVGDSDISTPVLERRRGDGTSPPIHARSFVKDKLLLIGCALLVMFITAAIAIGVATLGR